MSFVEQSERRERWFKRAGLIALLSFFIFLIAGFFWATSTPGESYAGPAVEPEDPTLAARLEERVTRLASGPRNLSQTTTVLSTVDYLTGELSAMNYKVVRQEVVTPADNLIVRIAAADPNAPTLIIGAHYDTAGATPGADDNATGVAALLELAQNLKALDGRARTNVDLIFYANEEPPYFKTNAMGSFVHAQSLTDPDQVAGMIALDSLGYFSDEPQSQDYPFPLSLRFPSTGNFIAFVGTTSSRSFLRERIGEFRSVAKIPSVGGTAPPIIQGIDWSDHWAYGNLGVPAFMITDTALFRNPHYHRKTDTPDTLDYRRFALVVEGIEKSLRVSLI